MGDGARLRIERFMRLMLSAKPKPSPERREPPGMRAGSAGREVDQELRSHGRAVAGPDLQAVPGQEHGEPKVRLGNVRISSIAPLILVGHIQHFFESWIHHEL